MSKLEKEIVIPDIMKKHLDEYVDEFVNSPSDKYVIFDGTSEIKYEGDLKHCCAWLNQYGFPHSDAAYSIYSVEAYLQMLNTINKNE